jgi:hypothetical protein
MSHIGCGFPLFGGTPLWGQTRASSAHILVISNTGGHLGGGDFARVVRRDTGVCPIFTSRRHEVVAPMDPLLAALAEISPSAHLTNP